MSRYREQISAAIEAVTIRGPARYAWLGRASRPLRAAVEAAMDDSTRETYLVTSLGHELYSSFYCHGEPEPARWREPEPIAPDPALAAALSEANTGAGGWDGGWTVERVADGEAVLTSDVRVRVPVRDCRGPDGVRPGTEVAIRAPKEHVWLAPGFYTALSDTVVRAPFAGLVAGFAVQSVRGKQQVGPYPSLILQKRFAPSAGRCSIGSTPLGRMRTGAHLGLTQNSDAKASSRCFDSWRAVR